MLSLALLATSLTTGSVEGRTLEVRAPLICSRGPEGQVFRAIVSSPEQPAEGSEYSVRIDSFPSGTVSHFGLNYLFDMQTDYLLPPGASYVAGSARVVPNTGTPNVREGAKIWHESGAIYLLLPAHVQNGSSYTTPSIEFRLRVTAPVGSELPLYFSHYHVAAMAPVVGTVHTNCDPEPTPYLIAQAKVASASPAP